MAWEGDRPVDDGRLDIRTGSAPLRPRRLRGWLVAFAALAFVSGTFVQVVPASAVGRDQAVLAGTIADLPAAARDPDPTPLRIADVPDATPTGTPDATAGATTGATPTQAPTAVPTKAPVAPVNPACVATLQSRIDAAAAGSVLDLGGCTYSGGATIDKPLTILHASVQVGSGRKGLIVTSSNVTLDGVHVLGGQYGRLNMSEDGISAVGTASAPISNLTIRNSEVAQFGHGGLWLGHVSNVSVRSNRIHDTFYAGIMILSGQGGAITGNTVQRIGVARAPNAYGIALTDTETPVSANITVSGNTVTDVPTWHAFDTHGGQHISFTSNKVLRSSRGVFLTDDNLGNRATSITVQGNNLGSPAPVTFSLVAVTTYNSVNVTITGNTSTGWPFFEDYQAKSTGLVVSNNTIH